MGDLDKLLEKVTIEFPTPIMAEEIDGDLINYLRKEIPCEILYGLIRGEKESISFKGNITRSLNSYITIPNLSFAINGYHFGSELPIFFFNSIKIKILKYDGIERKGQLKLFSEVKQKIQEYFSQRTG